MIGKWKWFMAFSREEWGAASVKKIRREKDGRNRRAGSVWGWISFLLVFLLAGCSPTVSGRLPTADLTKDSLNYSYPHLPERPVKNIILMIGDGMGFAQITACRIQTFGTTRKLAVEQMPVTGYLYTHAVDNLITDSAAGATALAAGWKTRNGMIAMLPDSTPVKTILQAAQEKGKSTGLVATSSVTHATPACFAAHVPARRMESEIARQLIHAGVDVLLGGGRRFFVPAGQEGSQRQDHLNLLQTARERGYEVITKREELQRLATAPVVGLFKMAELENEPEEPSLAEMTQKSIELLNRNPRGFFLMVEGSQIDWGSHDNNLDYTIREMYAFDQAVKVALDFALKDRQTLVVVTADHETGGMAIEGGSMSGHEVVVDWTSGGHTGVPVPIYAFGPHSLLFSGVRDNTYIPKVFARLWHIHPFPAVIP